MFVRRLSLSLFLSVLLTVVIESPSSRVHSLEARSPQVQNSNGLRLEVDISDWWNAPVAIKRVRIGDHEVLSGASIEGTDDWVKHLSIDAINKSSKTISYIAYAVDFTIAGEKSLFRVRLQNGTFYLVPDALTAPNGLRIFTGQNHNLSATDSSWECQSTLLDMINARKAKITKVDLFVESVGFTDDTLWLCGANLTHNKAKSVFENLEYSSRMETKDLSVANHTSGIGITRGSEVSQPAACCAASMSYKEGGGRAVQISVSCGGCPGGGACNYPPPITTVNGINGPGNNAPNQVFLINC